MKLVGYCTECRRIKRVDVKVLINPQSPMGVCDECRDRKKERK